MLKANLYINSASIRKKFWGGTDPKMAQKGLILGGKFVKCTVFARPPFLWKRCILGSICTIFKLHVPNILLLLDCTAPFMVSIITNSGQSTMIGTPVQDRGTYIVRGGGISFVIQSRWSPFVVRILILGVCLDYVQLPCAANSIQRAPPSTLDSVHHQRKPFSSQTRRQSIYLLYLLPYEIKCHITEFTNLFLIYECLYWQHSQLTKEKMPHSIANCLFLFSIYCNQAIRYLLLT